MSIPIEKSAIFRTLEDNQSSITVLVLEGECESSEDNYRIGLIYLKDLEQKPAGEVEIQVSFRVDKDGILET